MRLFKPDCYAIITTPDGERLDLSNVSPITGRRLDIDFNCFLSEESEPNTGECTIYNLQASSRNKIVKDSKIELFAGYDGNYKLISIGDIQSISNRNPETDWQTNLLWGDGIRSYIDTNFSKSYKEGTDISTIISDLANSFGIAVDSIIADGQINGGLSIDGKTKDLLNTITNDYGLKWVIQDEVVIISQPDQPIDNAVIVLNKDTGLLEFPQVSEKGIDFEAQLNTDLRPNVLVDVQSEGSSTLLPTVPGDALPESANGINIVQTVRFVGNNYGGQFSSLCNCKAYDG